MIMKQQASYIFCFLLYFNNNLIGTAEDLQERSRRTIVIKKVSNCNLPGLKCFLENATLEQQYSKTHLGIRFRITDDCKSEKIKLSVIIKRCNDQGYNCEDYQNWKFDNFCVMITWKNQIWSELIDRIKPPFKCPFEKGIYEARNASLNMEGITSWFSNLWRYHWKVALKVLNENNDILHCSISEAVFQQNTEQERKPYFRKPKPNSRNIQ